MNAMNTMNQDVTAAIDSPDASGLRAVGCTQVAAKRGIHGLSPCCALCHGTDGLQKVYIDRRTRGLGGRVLLPPGRGPLRERS